MKWSEVVTKWSEVVTKWSEVAKNHGCPLRSPTKSVIVMFVQGLWGHVQANAKTLEAG